MNPFLYVSFFLTAALFAFAWLSVEALMQRNVARKELKDMAAEIEGLRNRYTDAREAADQDAATKRERIRMLEQDLLHTRQREAMLSSARNVSWTKPAKRMPTNEVRRAFAIDPASPIWIGLHQEIDDYLQEVMDQVSLPPSATLDEPARTHLAGGVEHVRTLQKRLLDLHDSAQKVDEDLDGDGAEKAQGKAVAA